MKLSALKKHLTEVSELNLQLPNGTSVPAHFHITELGMTTKHFIDCGGTERKEQRATFQAWVADDVDHRLSPEKLLKITDLAAKLFNDLDPEIEIEYQEDTIGRYGMEYSNNAFQLTGTQTDCLAKELCGVPFDESKAVLETADGGGCCSPESSCC